MIRKDDALTPPLARHLGQALVQALSDAGNDGGAEDDIAPVRIEPSAKPIAAALLAGRHPGGPAAQRQAQLLYQRCLAHYRTNVRQGASQDDVGHAAAWFVCANLAALHGHAVSMAQIDAVERQLRRLIAGHAGWKAARIDEKQSLFEQLATLGVLVGETQAQARAEAGARPDAQAAALANVQRAARGYLRQLLGIDGDALQAGEAGLSARIAEKA